MIADRQSKLTSKLASFISRTTFRDIPPAVIHEGKRLTLDLIANIIAGHDSELGRIIIEYVNKAGGSPVSTLIGNGNRTSSGLAAHANARCADALDFTDTFMNWYHMGPAGVLTALAVSEELGGSGETFLTAAILGTEIGLRLSLGAGDPLVPGPVGTISRNASGRRAIMPDYLFAATAAAAKAIGLDESGTAHAFGIAGASALNAGSSRWTELSPLPTLKYGDVGHDLYLGVYAAKMSALGLTAHPAILDGQNPLWKIRHFDRFDTDSVLNGLGEKWYILDNTYKPWPGCRFSHHALTAFCQLLKSSSVNVNDIERVLVKTHPWAVAMPHFRKQEPVGMVSCEFNIPHSISMLALGVPRGPSWYSEAILNDHRVKDLRKKVTVELEDSCRNPEQWYEDRQVGKLPTRVIVTAGGQELEGYIDYAWGDPRSPATRMSDDDLIAKFIEATSHRSGSSSGWDHRITGTAEMILDMDAAGKISEVVRDIAAVFSGTAPY